MNKYCALHPNYQADMFKQTAFYDIESLPNLFTLAVVYPTYQRSELFYAAPPALAGYFKGDAWQRLCQTIKQVNPELRDHQLTAIDLATHAGQGCFNNRFPYRNPGADARRYNDVAIHCAAVRKLDSQHQPINDDTITAYINTIAGQWLQQRNDSRLLTFYGYNSIDYDMTMLALLAQFIIYNPHDSALNGAVLANYMYTCNTLLFSKIGMTEGMLFTRQHNMSSVLYKNSGAALNQGLLCAAQELDSHLDVKTWEAANAIPGEAQDANSIYRHWRKTNRYLDTMNRQRKPAISLKKTASILGRKIKESNKLSAKQTVNTYDELADLIAYNYCDVLNTAAAYGSDFMQDFFNDRNALMKMFPFTVLNKDLAHDIADMAPAQAANRIAKNTRNDYLRYNRLVSDDTSANFAVRIIAPDHALQDNPYVSFAFPKKFNANADAQVTREHNRMLFHWMTGTDPYNQFYHNANRHIGQTIQAALRAQNDRWRKQLANMSLTNTERCLLEDMLSANDRLTTPYPLLDDNGYVQNIPFNHNDVSTFTGNVTNIYQAYEANLTSSYDALDDMLMWSWLQDQQYHTDVFNNIMPTYACYNWLRGRDFSGGVNNPQASQTNLGDKKQLALWFKLTSSITYYLDDRNQQTDCIVNFSYGGLHGAQINLAGFKRDQMAAQNVSDISAAVDATLKAKHVKSKKALLKNHGDTRLISDNPTVHQLHVKDVLAGNSQLYKKFQTGPKLFDKDGKLNKAYTMTSNNWTPTGTRLRVFHADFKSYYPTLMKLLNTFGDTYAQLYDARLQYKHYWKTGRDGNGKRLTNAKKREYERKATTLKLMLNAPTGKADENSRSNITMHNNIIAMRSIGQTFTWRIGQALSLRGAQVVSTNTDGLYIYVDDNDSNPTHVHTQKDVQAIIDQTVADMLIGVDADELYQFISRDTNNRVEVVTTDDNQLEIDDARGGDLAAYRDNRLDKSTTVPPLLNRVLADYLASGIKDISAPLNVAQARTLMMRYINDVLNTTDVTQLREKALHLLTRLGWTVSGNNGLNTYLVAHHLTTRYNAAQHAFAPVLDDQQQPVVDLLQRDNRLYFTVPQADTFVTLDKVAARKVTNHEPQDPQTSFAAYVMQQQLAKQASVSYQALSRDKKFSIQVYTKMPKSIAPLGSADPNTMPAWVQPVDQLPHVKFDDYYQTPISIQPITIVNDSLDDLTTDQLVDIIKRLDIDAYLGMVKETFATWQN